VQKRKAKRFGRARRVSGRTIDRFFAVDEEGNRYVVIVRQLVIKSRYVSGKRHITRGERQYALSTGEDVDPRNDGSFRIVETGKIIRRVGWVG
jgi:hypothetical protein